MHSLHSTSTSSLYSEQSRTLKILLKCQYYHEKLRIFSLKETEDLLVLHFIDSITLLNSSTIINSFKLRCLFCLYTINFHWVYIIQCDGLKKNTVKPYTSTKGDNLMSTFQHASAAEKEHMDSSINFLSRTCGELFSPIPSINTSTNKFMDLSYEDSFIEDIADLLDLHLASC